MSEATRMRTIEQAGGRAGILVLGMHRSGTSAITRVINLLGAKLPERLMGAAESNQRGHWEPASLVAAHDELLRAGGSSWDDLAHFDLDAVPAEARSAFRERILEILGDEYGRDADILVKDPRICRFLPFWAEILAAYGVAPKVVIPLRSPLEVAGSLTARDRMDPVYGQFLWLRHSLDAERDSRGMPRAFFAFPDLLQDWRGTIGRIGAELALDWPVPPAARREIEAFLSSDLRHQRSQAEDLDDPRRVPPIVAEAYRLLTTLARTDDDERALAALDDVKARFDRDHPALLAVSRAELEARRQLIEKLNYEAAHRGEDLKQARKQLGDQTVRADTLHEQVSLMHRQIVEVSERLGAKVAQLETEAHFRNLEIAEQTRELEGARQEAASARAQGASQLALARHELAVLRSSASWRATAPLRGAMARAPGSVQALRNTAKLAYWTASLQLGRQLRRRAELKRDRDLVRRSGEFDPAWYRETYPDVPADRDPVSHYLEFGAAEGRDPGPDFDGRAYLAAYPAALGANPLVHHLKGGGSGKAATSPRARIASVLEGEGAFIDRLLGIGLGDDGKLAATGGDPQIRVAFERSRPRGWYRFEADLRAGELLAPQIFLDVGEGYVEQTSVRLHAVADDRFSAVIYVPKPLRGFRFDPTETAGTFEIRRLAVTRIAGTALARLYGKQALGVVRRGDNPLVSARNVLQRMRSQRLVTLGPQAAGRETDAAGYQRWIALFDYEEGRDRPQYEARLAALGAPPLISVLMPVYNTPETYLEAAIDSVGRRSIRIGSSASPTMPRARRMSAGCSRTGDGAQTPASRWRSGARERPYRGSDELGLRACRRRLDRAARPRRHPARARARRGRAGARREHPDAELIYSDEDKIDGGTAEALRAAFQGGLLARSVPLAELLQPPDGASRRATSARVGGWRKGFEGSQDYDLNLRVVRARRRRERSAISRKILYHWRAVEGSTAQANGSKSYAFAGAEARWASMSRDLGRSRGVQSAGDAVLPLRLRVPEPEPLVSLIIPTRDRARSCASRSIRSWRRPTYAHVRDHHRRQRLGRGGDARLFRQIGRDPRVRVLPYPHAVQLLGDQQFRRGARRRRDRSASSTTTSR